MPVARLLTNLVISGVALLATGLVLSVTPARATVRTPLPEYDTSEFRYTNKSAAAATVGRTIDIYIVDENSMRPSGSASGSPCSNGTTR